MNTRWLVTTALVGINSALLAAMNFQRPGWHESVGFMLISVASGGIAAVLGMLRSPLAPPSEGDRVDAALREADKAGK